MILNPKKIIVLVISLLMLFNCSIPAAASPEQQNIQKAVSYLHSVQNDDGGFPYRAGKSSTQSVTCWVIMALASAGEDISSSKWAPGGANPLDFIKNCENELSNTCDYARTLLALTAAQQGTVYRGEDLALTLKSFQQEDGQFARISEGENGFINSHMWTIIALDSAGQEIPDKDKAREWLINRQNADGGYGWYSGISSDADDTAVALQALYILGEEARSEVIMNALAYLKTCQQEDGGFSSGYLAGNESNASSDAWVIQGLLSSGQNPEGELWSINHNNAVSHLLELQDSSGFFNWMQGTASSVVQTTAASLLALCQNRLFVDSSCAKADNSGELYILSDVSEDYWAYNEIKELLALNVLTGYPDETFKPENSVKRAEFTKMLVKALEIENNPCSSNFVDVPEYHWAFPYISICVHNGYIQGMPGDVFMPESTINGAQLSAVLARTLPGELPEAAPGPYWYKEFAVLAREKGLLYPEFQAENPVSRAQCAYSIIKLRELLNIE